MHTPALPVAATSNLSRVSLQIGVLVLAVMGIINAANGQCKPLPLIGQFTLLK